ATPEQWDAKPFLLNTPGGTVDLRTGNLRPCEPADYLTQVTACAPAAMDCVLWHAFLDRITDKNKELKDYLQLVFGYALSGSTIEHALFFLYGTGANGKSVLHGCMRWQRDKLSPPKVVSEATAAYLEAEDAIAAWLDECCELDANAWEASAILFLSWTNWATKSGEHVGTQSGPRNSWVRLPARRWARPSRVLWRARPANLRGAILTLRHETPRPSHITRHARALAYDMGRRWRDVARNGMKGR